MIEFDGTYLGKKYQFSRYNINEKKRGLGISTIESLMTSPESHPSI